MSVTRVFVDTSLMKARRLRYAFTFDRHFATAGFLRIPVDVSVDEL